MRSCCGNEVIFRLPQRDFVICLAVVQSHLPHFPHDFRDSTWNYQDEEDFQYPGYEKAITFLLKHLDEIQSERISSSLSNSLEKLWREDRRHRRCLYRDHSIEVFKMLGQILGPGYYGCSNALFCILSTFFTRHFDEIMHQQHGIPVWPTYVSSLEWTDHDVGPTLTLLTNYGELVMSDLRKLRYSNGGRSHCEKPSSRLQNHLGLLIDQTERHDYGQEITSYHGGGSVVGGDWATIPLRRRITRNSNSIGRGGIINGGDLEWEELLLRWKRDPDSITVDEGRFLLGSDGYNSGSRSRLGLYRPKRLLPRRGWMLASNDRRTPGYHIQR